MITYLERSEHSRWLLFRFWLANKILPKDFPYVIRVINGETGKWTYFGLFNKSKWMVKLEDGDYVDLKCP